MGKRIAAWIGIGVIVVCYGITLVASLTANPNANGFFMASIILTIVVPMILWIFIRLHSWAHKNDGITVREMKKIDKRIAAGENPEDIAKEIEEKYNKK